MFRLLTNKKKRDQAKEYVEVVFAVLTITAFAKHLIEKHRGDDNEELEGSSCSSGKDEQ